MIRNRKSKTSPLTAGMMQQDTAMSGILESENLTDAEKQKLYNPNMENYLSLRKQKDEQILVFNPTEAREFFRGLARLNVPRDIAGNAKRWEEVQEPVVRRTPLVQTSPLGTPEDRARNYRQFIRGRLMAPRNWVNY
jgi:hypothetical protein